jgi:excinuclease UvrABC nuclease subunit
VVASAVLFLNEQLGLRQCSGNLRPGMPACALLEMKKCLGPCVGAVSASTYRQAVETAGRVLRGQDSSVLERAAERRDALAEALRFEEAAEVRDRMRDLEQVVGVQQRLASFADRNTVLVTPDRQPDRVRLLLVRAGRLVEDVSVQSTATPSHLRHLLRRVYAGESTGHVSRDELDDLLILDAYLRRHAETLQSVPVNPADPQAAAVPLRAAVHSLVRERAKPEASRRRAGSKSPSHAPAA